MNQKSILKIISIIITLTFIISSLTGCINEVENQNGNSPIREMVFIRQRIARWQNGVKVKKVNPKSIGGRF